MIFPFNVMMMNAHHHALGGSAGEGIAVFIAIMLIAYALLSSDKKKPPH